ncbi:citrate lyase holo-[acyl-carrier protein] synthase [Lentilactobacillus raoultii]|uniref:citrate lyase holo-[acyl-carrier protein] synthase n=1 Tax=Lentilactobacillus raoultii TaxID=1987503 RepID=A0ABW3PHX6_9LACO|nr:citrate lyase holo-[acyl-carrier protein] synthase [Lentilactobacillus raoultii]
MSKSIFEAGTPQNILAVLTNKDQRAALQAKLLAVFPKAAVVAVKLNVAGPIKSNPQLTSLFDEGLSHFNRLLAQHQVSPSLKTIKWHRETGQETFMVFNESAEKMKRLAVNFEDRFELGRLFDVDVLTAKCGSQPLSRSDFGLAARRCLICDRPAKECARSRRHSVAELQSKISQMYQTYFN